MARTSLHPDAAPAQFRERGRAGDLLALALCGALLSAAWYAGSTTISAFVLGQFVALSRDYPWMSPLSYLLFFLGAWAPMALVGRFLSRTRAVQMGVLAFTSLAVFALMLPYTQIGRLSAAILALGAGTAAARVAGRAPVAWVKRARGVSVVLAALFAVVAVAAAGWRALAERRALAALPQAPAGAPNVLLLILDTVRGDELGAYGYNRPTTPNIDALAAKGTLFETAISTAPWTLPSHSSIFTGHYSGRLNADYLQPLDGREPTLAEVMARHGYATGGFAANLYYTSWDSGLDRGFIEYSDYVRSFEQVLKSSSLGQILLLDDLLRARTRSEVRKALRQRQMFVHMWTGRAPKLAPSVTDEFLSWSGGVNGKRPYFAFLNYFDAHDPYDPVPEFRARFAPDEKKSSVRDLYDADLAYLDHDLGRLFDTLERRGDLRNTIVIVTSDHGEHFGERGLWTHGNSVYYALLHVPLIVRFDGRVPAGARVRSAVSLRDLGATVLDLAGFGTSDKFPETSLAARWRGDSSPTSPAIAEYARRGMRDPTWPMEDRMLVSVVNDEWHLVREGKRVVEELFRYRLDPSETTNLMGSTDGITALHSMRQTIVQGLVGDAPDTAYAAARAREREAGRPR